MSQSQLNAVVSDSLLLSINPRSAHIGLLGVGARRGEKPKEIRKSSGGIFYLLKGPVTDTSRWPLVPESEDKYASFKNIQDSRLQPVTPSSRDPDFTENKKLFRKPSMEGVFPSTNACDVDKMAPAVAVANKNSENVSLETISTVQNQDSGVLIRTEPGDLSFASSPLVNKGLRLSLKERRRNYIECDNSDQLSKLLSNVKDDKHSHMTREQMPNESGSHNFVTSEVKTKTVHQSTNLPNFKFNSYQPSVSGSKYEDVVKSQARAKNEFGSPANSADSKPISSKTVGKKRRRRFSRPPTSSSTDTDDVSTEIPYDLETEPEASFGRESKYPTKVAKMEHEGQHLEPDPHHKKAQYNRNLDRFNLQELFKWILSKTPICSSTSQHLLTNILSRMEIFLMLQEEITRIKSNVHLMSTMSLDHLFEELLSKLKLIVEHEFLEVKQQYQEVLGILTFRS